MSKWGMDMFKNKMPNGINNLCGDHIRSLRLAASPKMSQRMLAERLQLLGIDLDKNAIQRIEAGKRFVTDIELAAFAEVFDVSCDRLLNR